MIGIEAQNHGHDPDSINPWQQALPENRGAQRLDGVMAKPLSSMKVVLLADYWRPGWRAGGPIVSLGRLVDRTEAQVWVFSRDHDLGTAQPYPDIRANSWQEDGNTPTQVAYLRGLRSLSWAMRQIRNIQPDVIHINSVHSPAYGILPLMAAKARLFGNAEVILTPHGELTEASQEHKRAKKRIAAPFLRWLTNRGITWHAASEAEAADIERWARTGDHSIVIVPDPAPAPIGAPSSGPNTPTVLFASRIHPIKGLREAIALVKQINTPVTFVVAGTVEDPEYWEACEADLASVPANITVQVHGAYAPADTAQLMDNATVLLLPTRGENFGQVIAEALSRGCPVAITPTTPWGEYIGGAVGCISADESETVAFLNTALSDDEQLRENRRNGVLATYRNWFTERGSDDLYGHVRAQGSKTS